MAIYSDSGFETGRDLPSIRPTLDLNFAATKTLDRRITFSRDSLGTYVDELGVVRYVPNNVPRFDHDPTTGESLGLLIEESRTNLFPVSGDATDVNWSKLAVTAETDTSVIAPDGTAGATKVIQDNTTAQHLIGDSAAGLTLGGYYALSVFVKNGTHTGKVYFSVGTFSNWVEDWQFYIDFDTGEVANTTNVEAAKLKVEQYPNGWWRLSMVAQQEPAGTGSGGLWVGFGNNNGNQSSNFAGDGSSYFYVWGAQLEAGAFATSYIPTSGSTVTRAADIAKITGTNFTDFYGNTDHSFFVDFDLKNTTSTDSMAILTLPSATYPWLLYRYVDDYWKSYNGSDSIVNVSSTYSQTNNKFAFAIGSSNGSSAYNGSLTQTDQSALRTGLYSNASSILLFTRGTDFIPSGYLKQLKYYNKRLSNAQLQSLTS